MTIDDRPTGMARAACRRDACLARRGRRRQAARRCAARSRSAAARLVALWGERRTRSRRRLRACMLALACLRRAAVAERAAAARTAALSRTSPTSSRCADRMQRAAFDLLGHARATAARDRRASWLRHGAWPADAYPAAQGRSTSQPLPAPATTDYPFVTRRRRRRARDSGRAGACRHHRAGALPLLHRRRARAAAGRAPGLQAQGHREALRGA